MAKRLLNYFFRGIILTVPLALTIYLIYYVFVAVDSLFAHWFEFDSPGLGILTVLGLLTVIGFLGTTFIAQPILNWFSKLLAKAPLIKTIYDAIKDLLSAFVGQKKSFNQPVIVKLTENADLERLGFITEEDLSKFGLGEEKVAVYFPHSYNFSGNLFIVPRKNVKPINAKSADLMKFIVSAGVSSSN